MKFTSSQSNETDCSTSKPLLFGGAALAILAPGLFIKAGLFAGVYYLYKKADRSEMNSYMSQGADYAKMAGIEVVRGIKELKEINELKESSGQWKDDAANQTATASIEMPGVKSPEITVIDDKRLIKIKGLRKEIEETVENTVSVPEHVNISTLRVHMADGLLHLTASTIREGRVLQLDNEPGYQKL